MRKFLLLLAVGCTLLLVFGCSDAPDITKPDNPGILSARPEFVETRPPAEVASAILLPTPDYVLEKKPPKPDDPPDTGSADPNPNPPHKYAYIVGISDYEGTVNDLLYPDDDAMGMKNYFQGEGFTIRMDLNRSATADEIAAGLQWLVNQAQPGDEIAFSYSGHGAKVPGYGSSIISTDLYYMTHGYVMQIFNSADCSKKLVTLDCCVIGDFHRDTETGTVMATASNNTDSYDAPDLHHGAWTYYWLEAANDLNYIYAEDVAEYAENGMDSWADQYNLRVSPKHTDKYTGMFDM